MSGLIAKKNLLQARIAGRAQREAPSAAKALSAARAPSGDAKARASAATRLVAESADSAPSYSLSGRRFRKPVKFGCEHLLAVDLLAVIHLS